MTTIISDSILFHKANDIRELGSLSVPKEIKSKRPLFKTKKIFYNYILMRFLYLDLDEKDADMYSKIIRYFVEPEYEDFQQHAINMILGENVIFNTTIRGHIYAPTTDGLFSSTIFIERNLHQLIEVLISKHSYSENDIANSTIGYILNCIKLKAIPYNGEAEAGLIYAPYIPLSKIHP